MNTIFDKNTFMHPPEVSLLDLPCTCKCSTLSRSQDTQLGEHRPGECKSQETFEARGVQQTEPCTVQPRCHVPAARVRRCKMIDPSGCASPSFFCPTHLFVTQICLLRRISLPILPHSSQKTRGAFGRNERRKKRKCKRKNKNA